MKINQFIFSNRKEDKSICVREVTEALEITIGCSEREEISIEIPEKHIYSFLDKCAVLHKLIKRQPETDPFYSQIDTNCYNQNEELIEEKIIYNYTGEMKNAETK